MSSYTIINLPTFSDTRGSLTVLEGILPFSVVRSYWIYGADGQTRGGHRHVHTRQALVAINGTIEVYIDNGIDRQTIILEHPSQCLLVEPEDWHTMTFGKGAILLVMSSHLYDRDEYISVAYDRRDQTLND